MSEAPFSEAERRGLAELLDTLIPPLAGSDLPGAGEIGIGEQIEARAPDLRAVIRRGMARLDEKAGERGARGFGALPPQGRREALEALSAEDPAFLPGLVFQTYVHYYQHARVVRALDLEPRPPHPRGYPLEQGDLSSLDRVRARGSLYRRG